MLHTMASQINQMSDKFTDLLCFKDECMNMIKTVLDNQNAIKQELFVLRNLKHDAKPAVTVVDAATEVDLSNQTTNDNHPPTEHHSQSNAPDPNTQSSNSSKSMSGEESSSTPLTVTPSSLLYMSDFDNLIDASKLREVTNINNTFKKISVHKEGTLAEFLPEFVDEQVKTNNPECLLLHTGSSNLSRSRRKNSKNIFEHSKQDAIITASNVFSTAVRALKLNHQLKKVMVFKQPQKKLKSFSRRSKLAYDRVFLSFLLAVMKKMNISTQFCKWVKMLHSGAKTRFILAGGLSQAISLTFSIRQGDPLAMLLYIIFIEPLVLYIEKRTTGCILRNLKGAEAYCDDLNVMTCRDSDILLIDQCVTRLSVAQFFRETRSVKSSALVGGKPEWTGL